jgi:hypothetical protein
MLRFPGDDPRADLTDLFVFASPQSPGNAASSFDLNPFTTGADFNPKAVFPIAVWATTSVRRNGNRAIALSVWGLAHIEHRWSAKWKTPGEPAR